MKLLEVLNLEEKLLLRIVPEQYVCMYVCVCVCVYGFSIHFLPGVAMKCLRPAVFILIYQDRPSWLGISVVLWLFMLIPEYYVCNLQLKLHFTVSVPHRPEGGLWSCCLKFEGAWFDEDLVSF
jgi:hypothetical protein